MRFLKRSLVFRHKQDSKHASSSRSGPWWCAHQLPWPSSQWGWSNPSQCTVTRWGSSSCTGYVLHRNTLWVYISTLWEIMRIKRREEKNILEKRIMKNQTSQRSRFCGIEAEVSDPAEASQILPRSWRKETLGKDFSSWPLLGGTGRDEIRTRSAIQFFSIQGHWTLV